MSDSYKEYREQLEAEQSDLSYDEIKHQMTTQSEAITELDNLPVQEHRWVDRGLKMTCEHANHPYHEAWKRGAVKV